MPMGLMDFVQDAKTRINEVDVDGGLKMIMEGCKVLDVREPAEYLAGAIEDAVHVPRGVLEPAADMNYPGANPELRDGRGKRWLVVCRSGGRSALAADTLMKMGFTNVTSMIGGMDAWESAGYTTITPSDENSLVQLKQACITD